MGRAGRRLVVHRRDRLGRPVRLRHGGDDPLEFDATVYRLDACRLEAEPVAACFADFLRDELARNATAPRDETTVAARRRFGDLEPSVQLTYVPSLLAGGDEDLAHVVELGAREAMTLAGDSYRALGRRPGRHRVATAGSGLTRLLAWRPVR